VTDSTDSVENQRPARLPPTPRQLRLRYMTWIVLGVIVLMIAVGMLHPFFHMKPPAALVQRPPALPANELRAIKQAFAAKLLLIGLYWAACIVLTLLLPVFAWLYTREIHLQELMARRDIWREVAGKRGQDSETGTAEPKGDRGE
jgi:hypothetical protein